MKKFQPVKINIRKNTKIDRDLIEQTDMFEQELATKYGEKLKSKYTLTAPLDSSTSSFSNRYKR